MGLKKSKEFRFAWQDGEGKLRAVVIQAEHADDDGQDEVTVTVSGDGVPLVVKTFSHPDPAVVKTRFRP